MDKLLRAFAVLFAIASPALAAAPIGSPVNLTQIAGVVPSTSGVVDAPGTLRVYNVAPSGTVAFPAGALPVTSTSTVISTGSITAFQGGGTWAFTCVSGCSGGGGVGSSTAQVTGLGGGPVVGALAPVATPTASSQTITSSASVQVLAADSARRTYSVTTLPSNTDVIYCRWGTGPALVTDPIVLGPSTNLYPSGAVETLALNCIANSGNQVIRGYSFDQ